MHRHGNVKEVFGVSFHLFLVCTVTTHFVSELLTVESLFCYCASFFFFLFILNHSFSVVSARSWYHSSACNHNNSLIMFIDFNIETIKPLAPHSDSKLLIKAVQYLFINV